MSRPYASEYDSRRSYASNPAPPGFGQHRMSSSTSQAQAQVLPSQPFQPQYGNLDDEMQYSLDQSTGWAEGDTTLLEATNMGGSHFNPGELNNLTRPESEDPWSLSYRTPVPSVNSGSSWHHLDNVTGVPKANTVAGAPYADARHSRQSDAGIAYYATSSNRPFIGPRQSYVSNTDSGYVSYTSQPIIEDKALTSHAETKDPELISIASSHSAATKRATSVRTEPSRGRVSKSKPRRSKSTIRRCPLCNKELHNKSEEQKHRLQHVKPNHCERCPEKGFATVNDLERHRKSVHGLDPRVGKKSVYICQACPRGTPGSSKPRTWPRKDNFKAHVRRKHGKLNEEQLIRMSEVDKVPDATSDHDYSQHSTSIPPADATYQNDWSSTVDNTMSRHPSQHQPDFNTLLDMDSSHQVAHTGGMGDFQVYHTHEGVPFRFPDYSGADGMTMLKHAADYQQMRSPVDSMISPTSARQSLPILASGGHTRGQYQDVNIDRATKRPRAVSNPTSSLSHTHSLSQETVSTGNSEGQFPCPECGKRKRRECDLRKHMKRHTRPYGCTFAGCTKKFGSRNDWKRHENSQHYLAEAWRCDIRRKTMNGTSSLSCGFLAPDQAKFVDHLQERHRIEPNTEESRKNCRDMHLGREGHHHFWCGFCNKLIGQDEGLQPGAWDVRFKHIGDHFDKHNKNIDDWIDIEKNKKKKLLDSEEQSKKSSAKTRFDDDSDLGEDGIPAIPVVPGAYAAQSVRVRRMPNVNEEADADGVSDDEWDVNTIYK